jgi:hypothetical protein
MIIAPTLSRKAPAPRQVLECATAVALWTKPRNHLLSNKTGGEHIYLRLADTNSVMFRHSGMPSLQYCASLITEPCVNISRIWKML